MPAFDKFAYSDGRCYGKKQADLRAYPTRMPDPPATLQQREINIVLGAAKGRANHVLARELSTTVTTVLLWRNR